MDQPLVSISGVSKSFGKTQALKGVDLSLYAGQCLVLMGVNGAGKTTLLNILQGLVSPTGGEVKLFGYEYRTHRDHILQSIGVVMQETLLYKRFTVTETLELFASFYPKKNSYEELLSLLDLTQKRREYLKNLSGGQKQKLYIATALLHQPAVLFLDEPTEGLDPTSRKQIWQVIQSFQSRGGAVFLTTHYLEEAELLADHLAILHQGKILAEGPAADIVSRFSPHTSVSISLPSANDLTREAAMALLQTDPRIDSAVQLGHQQLQFTWQKKSKDLSEIAEITEMLASKNLYPTELSIKQGSLDEVFSLLTGKAAHEQRSL